MACQPLALQTPTQSQSDTVSPHCRPVSRQSWKHHENMRLRVSYLHYVNAYWVGTHWSSLTWAERRPGWLSCVKLVPTTRAGQDREGKRAGTDLQPGRVLQGTGNSNTLNIWLSEGWGLYTFTALYFYKWIITTIYVTNHPTITAGTVCCRNSKL